MNQITGKIVRQGTAVGVPDLLVVVYDVDPGIHPEQQLAGGLLNNAAVLGHPTNPLNNLGTRIGSVLTRPDGSFELLYEDAECRSRNEGEQRPDLFLLVLAPEAPGTTLARQVLFVSPGVRRFAGRVESYHIQLTEEQLAAAGLPVPTADATPDDPMDRELDALEKRFISGQSYFGRKVSLLQTHIEREHKKHVEQREADFSSKVREELSQVSKSFRESRRFVADGQSIKDLVFENATAEILETFEEPEKKPVAKGFVYLTAAQVAKYEEFLEDGEFVLPGPLAVQEILPLLFGGGEGAASNDFIMDHPAVRLCARAVHGEVDCSAHAHEVNGEEEEDGNSGKGGAPSGSTGEGGSESLPEPPSDNKEYIARQIARQFEHVSPPEGVVNFGVKVMGRASAGQIGDYVGQFQLEKGPADTPAYYEFHTLKIAFKHVWKEATDQGILTQGEALYDEVVGAGKKPSGLKSMIGDISSTGNFLDRGQQSGGSPVPPIEVIFEFPDVVKYWDKMTSTEQKFLLKLTRIILGKYADNAGKANPALVNYLTDKDATVPYLDKGHLITNGANEVISLFRQKGRRLLDAVAERVEEALEAKTDLDRYKRAAELAESLNNMLKQQYSFTYFAADGAERSVNFGVLLTYMQTWAPAGYQAGELVKSIPLAPRETRKYSKRTVVKKTRSQKEIEDNLRVTKSETAETTRAEAEIVNKALNKSTFALNTTSTFDIPLGENTKIGNTVTTNLTNDAQRESNQTKKELRESVVKAAQEFKNERRVEITTDTSYESEVTESGEITNPNDELTVTYLFYELQRQYRVKEQLRRMRPVVLVAQEMPAPHEIDDDWIIRHDWILKRALMDDSFQSAFDCVKTIRGDRLMLEEIEGSVTEQRKVIRDLRQNVKFYTEETGRMSRFMQAAVNKEADVVEDRDFWDGIPLLGTRLDAVENAVKGVGSMLGMGQGDDPKEAARIRREGVKDSYERADRERRELMGRLERETGVFNALTRQVAEKRREINEKEVLIARLKNHLKDNILHYMQTIWSYEHPDQRFFRLFNTKVPQITAQQSQFNLRVRKEPEKAPMLDEVVNFGRKPEERKTRHAFTSTPVLRVEEKTLEEVAEIHNLLGFMGNYMIFPLRRSNALTDFMMTPYVDSEFGLLDPDAPGNWTLEEFEQLYCCLKESLGSHFAEVEEDLNEFYRELLQDPLRPGEIIAVPTSSLFIEALPGEHSVLENFKALHRAADVKKAQAEVRLIELENIRHAARILEGEREDPDIEKKIVVEGGQVPVLDS